MEDRIKEKSHPATNEEFGKRIPELGKEVRVPCDVSPATQKSFDDYIGGSRKRG
jgi:microsomal dipeptidase-like Zn-dependent dipeptidase